MLEKQMRVEELLGREMTIRWFEGVALIQAICRQLAARDGRQDVFPTAAEIVLAADGTVGAVHPSGHTAVRTAAQLLARMLGEDVPVRLRLIVAQATGADTAYPTLEEFSTALAYYERPDGAEVLRALFERAVVAPVRAVTPEQASAPLLSPEEEYQDRSRTRTHLRLVVGAAITAVCVVAALLGASAVDYNRLGVAFSSLTSGSSGPSRAPSRPRPKTSPVGTVGGRSEARRDAERAPEPSGKAVARTASGPAAERTNERATAARPTARKEPLQVAALLPLNPMRPSPVAAAAEYRPVFGETVEITASEAGPENGVDADGARIYSRGDTGVVPPRSVYPKLPSDPPGGSEPDNRTVLELVIGTNGLVERAMLRSIPRDIHEFMLVSAAKAWIFEPATVEGLPVRYRHRVRISLP